MNDWQIAADEEWRQVDVGSAHRYEVSNYGRVRSHIRGVYRLRKPYWNSNGYATFGIHLGSRSVHVAVHRMVARAFLPETGPVVRHLDGNPRNNHVSNLAWGTYSENNFDMVRHGTHWTAKRTHCWKGHEFTPENTYWRAGEGASRRCRACKNARERESRAQRRAAA